MKHLITLFFFILTSFQLFANDSTDVVINNYNEKIVVHSIESGFTRYISIYGTCNKRTYFMFTSIDQLNDSLSNFKLYYKKRKRYDEVDHVKSIDSPGFSHFHDTRVIKIIELDSGNKFHCTFRIDCKKLILFTSISFSSVYTIDSAKYLVAIPASLSIKCDWVNSDMLVFKNVSQFVENDTQYLDVSVKPAKISLKNKSLKYPALRLIIVPKAREKSEDKYFNNWYLSSINGVSLLNQSSKRIIDSIAIVNSNRESLVSAYYEYIKKNFKYLDVIVGMGAFIPHDVNTVLNNRQGDCKDLASLLCAILKYKGFESNVAFAATNNYFFDFNFPSLCSGNHMICTVKTDSVLLLLDPTDINHIIGQPVQSLQGKTIFVTDSLNPYYYTVPTLPQQDNNYTIDLNLAGGNNTLKGDFMIVATGYIFNDLKWMAARYSAKEFQQIIEYKIRDIFHNQSIDSIRFQIYADSIKVNGKIIYFNKYYTSNDLIYLFLDYVPGLFTNEFDKNKITEETFIGNTMNKKFSMQVILDNTIKDVEFAPFSVMNNSYSLDFNVKKQNEKTISVNYQFIYNKTWINNSDIEDVNSLIDNFIKKTHETVVIHF